MRLFVTYCLLGLGLLLAGPLPAQTWELAGRSTSRLASSTSLPSIARFTTLGLAPGGQVVVAGQTTLKPEFLPLGSAGDSARWPQGFLARLNPRTRQWTQLIDVNSMGGSTVDHLLVLPGGDVLLTGVYYRDVYGPVATISTGLRIRNGYLPSPAGPTEGYVARLDSTGTCRWLTALRTLTGQSRAQPQRLALGSGGTAWVVGAFAGQMQVGTLPPLTTPTAPTAAAATDTDLFAARLNLATGQWEQALQASGPGLEQASDVAVLPGGDLLLAGSAQPAATFGSLPPLTGRAAVPLAFVARLDPGAGQWRWVQAMRSDSLAKATRLALLPNGNVAVSGTFVGPAQAGALSLAHGLEHYSTFVACLSPGGQWQWGSTGGGGVPVFKEGELVATPAGQLLISLNLSGRGRFGDLPEVQAGLPRSSNTGICVAQLDGRDGRWQWLTTAGNVFQHPTSGRYQDNVAGGLLLLDNATALVSGSLGPDSYLGTDVGPLQVGRYDGFVARLTLPTVCPTTAPADVQLARDSTVCANTATLRVIGAAPGSGFQWSTGATGPTLTVREPGTYTVTVRTSANCTYQLQATVAVPRSPNPPNVITPDGDGHNDRWQIPGLPAGTALRLYSRWGRLVYRADDYAHDWAAENLPAGLYFYVLTSDQLCAGPQLKGWVEVVR